MRQLALQAVPVLGVLSTVTGLFAVIRISARMVADELASRSIREAV
ncbi:hypothetical protein [Nocardia sp. NPDC020380]